MRYDRNHNEQVQEMLFDPELTESTEDTERLSNMTFLC